jgi:hypothetical protein
MKNNFIVFSHDFNELDMILPFIDYALTKYKDSVILYSDRKNIAGADCHLEYLKEYHNINQKYFYDEQCFGRYKKFLSFRDKIKQVQFNRRRRKNIRYISYVISLILLMINRANEIILEKPIKRYVGQLMLSNIIMVYVGGESVFPYSVIVKYAEKRCIKTIGFFQGFYLYSNLEYTGKSITAKRSIRGTINKFIKRGKRQYCTYYLTGRTMKNTFFCSGAAMDFKELERVYETVTPRYTRGWTKKFRAYLMKDKQFNYGDEKKINVVFFMSSAQQNVNCKEFIDILHLLSRLDKINFVYKPHPRGPFEGWKYAIGASLGLDEIVINGYDGSHINSMVLSEWTDVGIVFGSSIAIQLLIDNVTIIVPSFVHTNSTILEKHKICITADSLGELINILTNNSKDDLRKLIDSARATRFLNEYLDADKDYEQIMQEYYEAVVNNGHENKDALYI